MTLWDGGTVGCLLAEIDKGWGIRQFKYSSKAFKLLDI
jgi:hypothetical protein